MKKPLLKELEELLESIIEQEGWQEMADGCNRAIDVVKKHLGEEEGEVK